MSEKTRADLIRRLAPYWKMEAANVLFVPLFVMVLSKGQLGWISVPPLAATMLLLVIGALYWRGKVRQIAGQPQDFVRLLRGIAAMRRPALVLTVAACVTAAAGWVRPAWSLGPADRYVAAGCALLAVLEYVNYYHRQLQHFDNRADFLRMVRGRGFRRSWMARDLAALAAATEDRRTCP